MNQNRCINYFTVNGRRYYTGTVFFVKEFGKVVEAVFVCCTDFMKHTHIVYKIKGKTYFTEASMFAKQLVRITDAVDDKVQMPRTQHLKDSQINGLPLGWLWYIFLMGLATIFKGNIVLWIFISVVFFNWRSKKIKEEGTYIEW